MTTFSNENLQSLLSDTARGDTKAFKTFYDETSGHLLAVAATIMRDPGLAEDVLQDAFVQIWHRAGEYHAERGAVITWLTTIVRYRAIDTLRKRGYDSSSGKSRRIDLDPDSIDFLQRSDAEDKDTKSGPLARALAWEENLMLRDCIDRLSNNQQQSVALAFFRGFTHQELSTCLAEPLGTIKSRLRRSLVKLKDCLQNLGDHVEV